MLLPSHITETWGRIYECNTATENYNLFKSNRKGRRFELHVKNTYINTINPRNELDASLCKNKRK